jgi:hypothetical protein
MDWMNELRSWFRSNGRASIPKEQSQFPRLPIPIAHRLKGDGTDDQGMSEIDEQLWTLGWYDGHGGLPQHELRPAIEAEGRILLERLTHEQALVVARQTAVSRQSEESSANLKRRLTSITEELEQLEARRSEKSQAFSLPIGLVFVFVATLLFLADIPLSLRLVARGFDLKTESGALNVDMLLIQPVTIFVLFWEPILLALGIAFSGLFVKFFYDEVLPQWTKQLEHVERYAMLGMFILFLATIICLGWFRAEIQRELTTDSARRIQQQMGVTTEMSTQVPAQSSPTEPVSGGLLAKATFILLTLTFPLTGAVCFSAGMKQISNYWRLRSLRRLVERISLESEKAIGRWHEAQAMLKSDEEWLAFLRADKSREAVSDLRQALYAHGYQRGKGATEPLFDEKGLYGQAASVAKWNLVEKARRNFWKERQ